MRRRSEELAQQLQEQGGQMEALQGDLRSHGGDARIVERLRSKLQRVEQEHTEEQATLQRALSKHKKEVRGRPCTPNVIRRCSHIWLSGVL